MNDVLPLHRIYSQDLK